MSDDQAFGAVWYLSLLLMVLAAAVPLARSQRQWLRNAAWWVLIGGSCSLSTGSANGSCNEPSDRRRTIDGPLSALRCGERMILGIGKARVGCRSRSRAGGGKSRAVLVRRQAPRLYRSQ